jgi:hypothetical protein
VCVCVCEWRGEFNRVVLVVQLCVIFHFILNPEQRRVFQLVLLYLPETCCRSACTVHSYGGLCSNCHVFHFNS